MMIQRIYRIVVLESYRDVIKLLFVISKISVYYVFIMNKEIHDSLN